MRFPSLFRLPRHQRFHVEPRYYDPIKEDIKNRTDFIKGQMGGKERKDYHLSRIKFKRKSRLLPTTSMIRLGIALLIGIITLGWLQFGVVAFYYLLCVVLFVYLIFRSKILKRKR